MQRSLLMGGVVLACLLTATAALVPTSAADKKPDDPQEKSEQPTAGARLMRAKLASSNLILEGMVVEDFKAIEEGALRLQVVSALDEWRVSDEPVVPTGPVEDSELLLGELQDLLLEVRGLIGTSGGFPWPRLETLIDRAVTSLERSPDLFWVANNPAAPPGVDYLAFHQARVAVMAIRIGVNVSYEPRRLRTLGLAGCLIDVALWQMQDTLLRPLDSLAGEELAAYRGHPRVSAEIIRRWNPSDAHVVQAVLEHHEREQGQGFPQGLVAAGHLRGDRRRPGAPVGDGAAGPLPR